eukprot:TRINITY_DN26261_c0_g2_i2.p5 TRINITY_DN26261_c0_g2~~TRINITY_DN26261_c0_g2_i2.p5  ORF type:complete len:108 (-),score=2.97 TRINITY_DN26261_c0_g2_i2:121-444(-)
MMNNYKNVGTFVFTMNILKKIVYNQIHPFWKRQKFVVVSSQQHVYFVEDNIGMGNIDIVANSAHFVVVVDAQQNLCIFGILQPKKLLSCNSIMSARHLKLQILLTKV